MASPEIVKGRYELGQVLGHGASAMVFEAIDLQQPDEPAADAINHRRVAVKRMKVAEDRTHQDTKDWEREAALLKQLQHANIVKYFDSFHDGGNLFVVMELATQGSLLQRIKKEGPLGEDEASRCVAQVLRGLLYLHKKGVVHRDIKAANCIYFDDGTVKLTDFGLAAIADAAASETDLVGSVYWMAPEAIRKDKDSLLFIESSDIWSVGCLTVEILSGSPPFYDRRPHNALYHIAQSGEVEPPDGVSAACADFVRSCCNRDVKQRPNAAQLLTHEWITRGGEGGGGPAGSEQSVPEDAAARDGIGGAVGGSSASLDSTTTMMTPKELSATAGPPQQPKVVAVGGAAGSDASGTIPPQHRHQHSAAAAAGGPSKPTAPVSLEAAGSYPSWVEHNLLSDSTEQWLQEGGLARTITALGSIKADEAFQILHCIAHTAKQSIGIKTSFFVALGACGFWNLELSVLGTRENIVALFEACCRAQPPNVLQYAPADVHALTFVLAVETARPQILRSLAMLLIGAAAAKSVHASLVGTSAQAMHLTQSGAGVTGGSTAPLLSSSNGGGGGGGALGPRAALRHSMNLSPVSGGGAGDQNGALSASGASGGVAGSGGAAANSGFVAAEFDVAEAWRKQARDRFVNDGAINVLYKALVEKILGGFVAGMESGSDWTNLAFDILFSLSKSRSELTKKLWLEEGRHALVCLTEGCRLRMRSAICILAECTRQSPLYVGDAIKALHFIQVAVDATTDHALRVEVVKLFPLLMRSEAAKATFLDADSSVPLLAHILSMSSASAATTATTSLPSGTANSGDALSRPPLPPQGAAHVPPSATAAAEDEILAVYVELCRDPVVAAAFWQYPKMLTIVVKKMINARVAGRGIDLHRGILMATAMFEQADRPDVFVTSTDLSRVLAMTIQESGAYGPAVDAAARTLLDALGAQSKIV